MSKKNVISICNMLANKSVTAIRFRTRSGAEYDAICGSVECMEAGVYIVSHRVVVAYDALESVGTATN